MKEEINKWIKFSEEDLRMAELALKEKIYNQVCFHSQQCIEKALKGFINSKEQVCPKTHKLADLLSYLSPSPFDYLTDIIIPLDRFYIPTRYPDALPGTLPEGLPVEKDVKEAIEVARLVLEKAEKETKIK
ncbi:HEPN domain-containing protein [Candidatus Aerophobetes bacterium]|nr:HEPN domain-containing protein [Candidatus Aerophobetes bacterium]